MAEENLPPDPFGGAPASDLLAMGISFFQTYQGFLGGGFTEKQAFELTKIAVQEMFKVAYQNNKNGNE